MNAKHTLLGIAVFCAITIVSMIGNAEAKSMDASDIYGEVYLYSGESLTIHNNLPEAHSLSNIDGIFDTGLIPPGKEFTLEMKQRGTYSFFDSSGSGKSGTIHVIIPEIKPISEVKAGDLMTIQGIDFNPAQTVILITKPDGQKYQELTITPAGNGAVYLPIQTSKYDENGTYQVRVLGYDSANASFTVSGGVTQDNPIEETPIINGTATNSTTVTVPTSQPNPDKGNTTTQTTQIPTIPISFDKEYLIQYAKDQIKFWTQMLAFLEGN